MIFVFMSMVMKIHWEFLHFQISEIARRMYSIYSMIYHCAFVLHYNKSLNIITLKMQIIIKQIIVEIIN